MIPAEQLENLAAYDVFPLPLVTETNWAVSGWEVVILALTEVNSGHGGVVLWTHREPCAPDGPRDAEQARRATAKGVEAFAHRLAEVLAPNESGSWEAPHPGVGAA